MSQLTQTKLCQSQNKDFKTTQLLNTSQNLRISPHKNKYTSKELELLLRIFENIVNNPNNLKYQALNVKSINQRINNSVIFWQTLWNAGFYKYNNRVLFDQTKIESLTTTYNSLLSANNNNKYIAESDNYDFITIGNRLKNAMKLYSANKINQIDIKSSLDDFLHLLAFHNSAEEFEKIYKKLNGNCENKNCDKFNRLFTNQYLRDFEHTILDKIHCYYRHSYNNGLRLSVKQRNILQNSITDEKNNCLSSNRLTKMNEIISQCSLSDISVNWKHNKFTQLDSHSKNDSKQFSFGYQIEYKNDRIYIWDISMLECPRIVVPNQLYKTILKAKYATLKEELTCNQIITVSIDQFESEYKKAKIHLKTYYCKNVLSITRDLLQSVLAVMMYCNYTDLQFKFSKTCRDFVGCSTFYHLGKNIKCAIFAFGTESKDGIVQALYHGIGEQLVLPQYIGADLDIFTPLSTTSSFVVAINFTNVNNGLIIEFGNFKQKWKDSGSSRYLSVSWLS
eukprot:432908_1